MASSRTRETPEAVLRRAALAYPETHEDFPWGHRAIKVRGKMFLVLSGDEPGSLSLSVKLPWSAEGALQFPFCEPTGYGMGRSGWVTATFRRNDRPPIDMLRSWIDESYRAVAPKRLVASLAAAADLRRPAAARRRGPRAAATRRRATRRGAAR